MEDSHFEEIDGYFFSILEQELADERLLHRPPVLLPGARGLLLPQAPHKGIPGRPGKQ